ncbi:cell cycle regulatory protein, putative [Talaromyces stipitatus ATCC 10500]|uniref:Cell cycle regulatory protein, putative n=1 Tax=Talaromyces stipitatus (strain ATCC 10500 / CBS 375.48 / QM 6759 / NRRL 1006) TaxID=441959 RepID=B8LWQ7_TALSN|nr:cell cycle regulatory protein, putative [Talaromyces stipitatus ATCC 10500]EED24454.1 cell cycle regulatory protein, putative [Talaromyces stipitatus ATCC 10500]
MPKDEPSVGYVSRSSSSNHVSAFKPAVPCQNIPENLRCTRHRIRLAKSSMLLRDRFVPQRSYSGNTISKFHVRKLPVDLAAHEKLLRQQENNENPFCRRRRRMVIPIQFDINDLFQPPHMSPHLLDNEVNPRQYSTHGPRVTPRQVSVGAVWNVGGASIATRGPWLGIAESKNGYSSGKVPAPMYYARYVFDEDVSLSEETEMNMSRLAAAIDIDLTHRQLAISKPATSTDIRVCPLSPHYEKSLPLAWRECGWKRTGSAIPDAHGSQVHKRPSIYGGPFHVLRTGDSTTDDDFYHSVLAYCQASGLLAFAAKDHVILWSTMFRQWEGWLPLGAPFPDKITAIAFSSPSGRKSILAVTTERGALRLWEARQLRLIYSLRLPAKVTCVAFKPTTTLCLSAVYPNTEVPVEHLAVGDDWGTVWYYAVEINPFFEALSRVTLLARIDAHHGCLCAITWSPDYEFLLTGGNDNVCLLFELKHILGNQQSSNAAAGSFLTKGTFPRLRLAQGRLGLVVSQFARMLKSNPGPDSIDVHSGSQPMRASISNASTIPQNRRSRSMSPEDVQASITHQRVRNDALSTSTGPLTQPISRVQPSRRVASAYYSPALADFIPFATYAPHGNHVRRFEHNSAVKAVAFAPWQPTLLATGGGMGDRTVYFYHAPTGCCLAKIYMWAQVTGLVWSKTRREITVVLGYQEYDHPYRVVVFAWPSCEQLAVIPWDTNEPEYPFFIATERAISTISISNFMKPTVDEADFDPDDECIAVASSNFIKFYRIPCKPRKMLAGSAGVMRSAILEELDGIENPQNEVIR